MRTESTLHGYEMNNNSKNEDGADQQVSVERCQHMGCPRVCQRERERGLQEVLAVHGDRKYI